MKRAFAWSLLPLIAAACGGGGSSGSGAGAGAVPVITAGSPTPEPTPTATPVPSSTPAPTASPTPTAISFAAQAAALYTAQPSISNCQAGQLTSASTAAMLAQLNAIRALHQLPPVTYSAADEAGAQQSALMQAANDTLSHSPPTSWKCYTGAGATASGQSNLYGGFGGGLGFTTDDQILAGWLTETNNIVADSVGHRRWLLYPFLGAVSYGRVVGASPTSTRADGVALKVFNVAGSGVANGALPAYVAYPFQDYPAKYFTLGSLLNFTVIASPSVNSSANATVNFANAKVSVTQRGGGAMTVSKVTYDNVGYGLPNNLQWAVAGLQANTIYDVTITGVVVNGAGRSYSYYFRVV